MPDRTPWVPAGGTQIFVDHRLYELRWHEGKRCLFLRPLGLRPVAEKPTYWLEGRQPHPDYEFDVVSFKTGRPLKGATVVARMMRCNPDQPEPKFPYWRSL